MIPNILLDWTNLALRDLYFVYTLPISYSRSKLTHLVPTDRAFFSSHSRLRMSPVVPVQTRRGGSGHERLFPLGRLFRSPRRGYGARLAQKLNRRGYVAGTREQAGSLLSFNILASPLAAAARGIDMRSGFRLVPLTFRSATRGTTRHGMTRHDTT